ncbi:MAG: class I SAM-dependent RNA methyltransferase [Anaerolineae bacterium]
MKQGDVIELELDAINHLGQALGRYEGKVVFVPYALPGERARVRIVEDRKRWARGELLDLLETSPHRVKAPCPYYGTCGGCQYQHVDAATQLAYKRETVVDQLHRAGLPGPLPVRDVRGTRGMDEPWAYRNHVQFTLGEEGELGFQGARSHEVVPIARCLLLHPLLDEMHQMLDVQWPELSRLSLRAGTRTGEQMVIFEPAGGEMPELEVDVPLSCVLRLPDGRHVPLIGSEVLHERLRERVFRISAGSFFQVNTVQAERLLDAVETYLDPEADDVLLDVYCGVGTFGLSLLDGANGVGRVIGVEESPSAVEDAWANATTTGSAGPEAVTLIEGRAEEVVPTLDEPVSKVVIDPPREGCTPALLDALVDLAPQRIAYVSCNPATLGRDLAHLVAAGYRLREVQPVDMFPQTYHIESVSWLQREEGG